LVFALLLLMFPVRFALPVFELTTAAPTLALFEPMFVTLAELLMLLSTRFAVAFIAMFDIFVLRLFALVVLLALFDAVSPQAANMLAASAKPATVINFDLIQKSPVFSKYCV